MDESLGHPWEIEETPLSVMFLQQFKFNCSKWPLLLIESVVMTKKEIDQAMRELEEKFQPGSDFRKLVATQKRIHCT
jgi:hypothetical protein